MNSERNSGLPGMANENQRNDAFVGYLMQMKYIAEGGGMSLGAQKRKQAAEVLTGLFLGSYDNLDIEKQEMVFYEIKNAFLKLIGVSKNGRGFTCCIAPSMPHFFITNRNLEPEFDDRVGLTIQNEVIYGTITTDMAELFENKYAANTCPGVRFLDNDAISHRVTETGNINFGIKWDPIAVESCG